MTAASSMTVNQMNNPVQTKHRMQELARLLREHSEAYYAGQPKISDAEFDKLMSELITLETKNPSLQALDSPTKAINQTLPSGVVGRQHAVPMLSLDNLTSVEDVRVFVQKVLNKAREQGMNLDGIWIAVEPKVDGLSASCTYENGRLVRVLTRGNGREGEDISANAVRIGDIHIRLPDGMLKEQSTVEVRGEIFMRPSVLNQLNAERKAQNEEPYANTRNCAVGSIKLKDPEESARRFLSFTAYELVCGDMRYTSSGDPMSWFSQAGVPCVQRVGKSRLSGGVEKVTAELMVALSQFDTRRRTMDMDTDGAVLKVMGCTELRRQLGDNGKFPNWAAAFKFAPEEAVTTLLGVTFQIGKHGTVTPVAELEPVSLAGSVVRRATLHNRVYLASLDLGVGCSVAISKAGEIIPQVVRRATAAPPGTYLFRMPVVCPACGGELKRDDEDAVAVRCDNRECCGNPGTTGTVVARLRHAVSKDALDVDGVGESLVQELVFSYGIRSASSMFNLDPSKVMTSLGVPFQTVMRYISMFKEAATSKLNNPERVLYALCIRNLGRKACGALVSHFGSVHEMMQVEPEIIRSTPDLQPAAADAWLKVRDEEWFKREIDQFESLGFNMRMAPPSLSSEKLKGQTWVITGELSDARERFEAVIKANGGRVTSSVSRKTTGLLVGDNPGGTKLKGAEKHSVKQYTEQQFWELLE